MMLTKTQEVGSIKLSINFRGFTNNEIKVYGAADDQKYKLISDKDYLLTTDSQGLTVKFSTPQTIKYLKLNLKIDSLNTQGAVIKEIAQALKLYSPQKITAPQSE